MPVSLLFHDVVENGDFNSSSFPTPDANLYKLTRGDFETHMDAIARAAEPVTLDAARRVRRPVLLTFDDGGASACPLTAGILEARGWRGYFFIATDYIGRPGFLDAEAVRELARRGHIVGSHSCSHPPRMSKCAPDGLAREWGQSVRVLSEIIGAPVDTASVPGGYYNRNVAVAAAAAGIRVLFNSEPTTRIGEVDGCRVLGRYSVQQGFAPETVAALAAGSLAPRLRQYFYWNVKKLAKAAGGTHWLEMRRRILARRS